MTIIIYFVIVAASFIGIAVVVWMMLAEQRRMAFPAETAVDASDRPPPSITPGPQEPALAAFSPETEPAVPEELLKQHSELLIKCEELQDQIMALRDTNQRLEKLLQEKTFQLNKTSKDLENEIKHRKEFNKIKDILEKELKDKKERCRALEIDLSEAETEKSSYLKRINQLEEKIKTLETQIKNREEEVRQLKREKAERDEDRKGLLQQIKEREEEIGRLKNKLHAIAAGETSTQTADEHQAVETGRANEPAGTPAEEETALEKKPTKEVDSTAAQQDDNRSAQSSADQEASVVTSNDEGRTQPDLPPIAPEGLDDKKPDTVSLMPDPAACVTQEEREGKPAADQQTSSGNEPAGFDEEDDTPSLRESSNDGDADADSRSVS